MALRNRRGSRAFVNLSQSNLGIRNRNRNRNRNLLVHHDHNTELAKTTHIYQEDVEVEVEV